MAAIKKQDTITSLIFFNKQKNKRYNSFELFLNFQLKFVSINKKIGIQFVLSCKKIIIPMKNSLVFIFCLFMAYTTLFCRRTWTLEKTRWNYDLESQDG